MRFSHFIHAATGLGLALSLASCGMFNKKSNSPTPGRYDERHATGCIQGVVIDGQTEKQINMNDVDRAKFGLWVQHHNQPLHALPISAEESLHGEYFLCGVPLDDEFPIFARFEGYQPFNSRIIVRSTIKQESPDAREDIRKPSPTAIYNIRLFPVGQETHDLQFKIVNNDRPLEGSQVRISPAGKNFFDDDLFLSPLAIRHLPMVQPTDANGIATFSAADLTLGAVYNYEILPPEGGANQSAARGQVTVGIRYQTVDKNRKNLFGLSGTGPYYVVVNLSATVKNELELRSSSLATQDYFPDGTITFQFNRPIRIVPGTRDEQLAYLGQDAHAELKHNIPGNIEAETMFARTEGDKLILSPNFAVQPKEEKELGLKIFYKGIKVQPVHSPGSASAIGLVDLVNKLYRPDLANGEPGDAPKAIEVPIFGGETVKPRALPQSVAIIGGNGQSGKVGSRLPKDLEVRVTDSAGKPLVNYIVFFSLMNPSDGGSLSKSQAITDGNGIAKTTWTLSSKIKTQQVQVKVYKRNGDLMNNNLLFSASANP